VVGFETCRLRRRNATKRKLFKVIQGHRFWYPSKPCLPLLLLVGLIYVLTYILPCIVFEISRIIHQIFAVDIAGIGYVFNAFIWAECPSS